MTTWLLDTNVLSELRHAGPEKTVLDFVSAQELAPSHVSAVTIGMAIASRDEKGFGSTGVSFFNPWRKSGSGTPA